MYSALSWIFFNTEYASFINAEYSWLYEILIWGVVTNLSGWNFN